MFKSAVTNPATGDMIWVVGLVLAVAVVAMVVITIISKKKGD